MISRATMNLKPAVIELNVGPASKCLLWVISGHPLRFARCPVFPQKRTLVPCSTMSALCQKRTHALQQKRLLFDHLVGGRDQRGRHSKAETAWRIEVPPNKGYASIRSTHC